MKLKAHIQIISGYKDMITQNTTLDLKCKGYRILNHIVKKIFNKSKTKNFGEIWVSFSIVGKALDLISGISWR
jgi:hypothetical protein